MTQRGDNLVTDSGFDGWILPLPGEPPALPVRHEWTMSGGKLTFLGSPDFNSNYDHPIDFAVNSMAPYQKINIENGKDYEVTYQWSRELGVNDFCRINLGKANGVSRGRGDEAGSYTETITAVVDSENDKILWIEPYLDANPGTCSYDNLTVRPVLPGQAAILTQVRDWAVEVLAALEEDTAAVFRTVAAWSGQIGPDDSAIKSFDRYAPFAFVQALPRRVDREGSMDPAIYITLEIAVGVSHPTPGLCLSGDPDGTPGLDRLIELVILAFDRTRPSDSDVHCDDFFLVEVQPTVVTSRRFAAGLLFEARWIPILET